jgi:hypothetical protein
MPHKRRSARAGLTALGEGPDRGCWSDTPATALLVATGEGDADALELFRRHRAHAVNGAMQALLDAGDDEAAVLRILHRAAASAAGQRACYRASADARRRQTVRSCGSRHSRALARRPQEAR